MSNLILDSVNAWEFSDFFKQINKQLFELWIMRDDEEKRHKEIVEKNHSIFDKVIKIEPGINKINMDNVMNEELVLNFTSNSICLLVFIWVIMQFLLMINL